MSRATHEPSDHGSWHRTVPGLATEPSDLLGSPATRRSRRTAGPFRLVVADAACGLLGGTIALAARPAPPQLPIAVVMLLLAIGWPLALWAARSYTRSFLWEGPGEFRGVLLAAGLLLGGVAMVAWAGRQDLPPAFFAVAAFSAAVLTWLQRTTQRPQARRLRSARRGMQNVLLVGRPEDVVRLNRQLRARPPVGYSLVGCCLPVDHGRVALLPSLPVLGSLGDVTSVVRDHDVDTVAVLPCAAVDGTWLRRYAWELAKTGTELLVAPTITEIAGLRVRLRPASGLPLLQVAHPEPCRPVKAVFDRVGAAALLLLLAPVVLAIAAAVTLDSRGPLLVGQNRVGRHGRVFAMLSFRTIEVGAEASPADAVRVDEGERVRSEDRDDPRVTRVGGFLRRHSLDQLPQLINVLTGDMSMVGPRPPLPEDLERHGEDGYRFVVKPGLTGLWQVSGRSGPSREESERVDVHYVENWSFLLDLLILWRTCSAVIRRNGPFRGRPAAPGAASGR